MSEASHCLNHSRRSWRSLVQSVSLRELGDLGVHYAKALWNLSLRRSEARIIRAWIRCPLTIPAQRLFIPELRFKVLEVVQEDFVNLHLSPDDLLYLAHVPIDIVTISLLNLRQELRLLGQKPSILLQGHHVMVHDSVLPCSDLIDSVHVSKVVEVLNTHVDVAACSQPLVHL